jgi:RimJ/RimL family protein N-acetyltransferase
LKESAVLVGKLVRLRPIEPGDRDRYFEWINDLEVAQFLEARGLYSMAQEDEFVRAATLQTRPPTIVLAIETLEESRHIGSIDLRQIHEQDRRGTLGIMIGDKEYWSRGYGTDAILTMLRYGFEELNLNRVDLTCDQRNARGIACYLKCGFIEEGRMRQHRFAKGRYWDTVIMANFAEAFFETHGRSAT